MDVADGVTIDVVKIGDLMGCLILFIMVMSETDLCKGSGFDTVDLMTVESHFGGGTVSLLIVESHSGFDAVSLLTVESHSGFDSVALMTVEWHTGFDTVSLMTVESHTGFDTVSLLTLESQSSRKMSLSSDWISPVSISTLSSFSYSSSVSSSTSSSKFVKVGMLRMQDKKQHFEKILKH